MEQHDQIRAENDSLKKQVAEITQWYYLARPEMAVLQQTVARTQTELTLKETAIKLARAAQDMEPGLGNGQGHNNRG